MSSVAGHLSARAWFVVAAIAIVSQAAHADEPSPTQPSLEIGAAVASLPDYPGSRTSSVRGRVWVDATLPTERFGTFALDSGSLTLEPAFRWSPFDAESRVGASLLLGYRNGRNSEDPSFASTDDGSVRLRGLPDVPGSVDLGFEAHARPFGVPVFGIARHAVHGTQGTTVDLGVYAPVKLAGSAELTFLPSVRWNDAREARAWYGIEPAAAAMAGRPAYAPGPGWQRAAFEVALDVPLAGSKWHAVASLAWAQLLGDAAHSPVVERRGQPMALLGVTWHP
jgi:outer membrane scaffolding protein for murein synthesis (MipA/OmpV family)